MSFSAYSMLPTSYVEASHTPMMEGQASFIDEEYSAFSTENNNDLQANSGYVSEGYSDNFIQFICTIATKGGAQFTKSSLKIGQQVHKTYKAGLHNPAKGLFKEYSVIKGIRPDFVDRNRRIIYELKPNNPRQITAGLKQLEKYKGLFEQEFGGVWKTVLDKY